MSEQPVNWYEKMGCEKLAKLEGLIDAFRAYANILRGEENVDEVHLVDVVQDQNKYHKLFNKLLGEFFEETNRNSTPQPLSELKNMLAEVDKQLAEVDIKLGDYITNNRLKND